MAAAEDGAVLLIDNQEGEPPGTLDKPGVRLISLSTDGATPSLSTDGADGAALLVDPRSINHAQPDGPIIDEEADRLDTRFLGGKTIGLFGSIALTVNNVSGPGMLQISKVFQEAGWLAPCVAFVLVCVVSSFAVTLLADTIARLPGNGRASTSASSSPTHSARSSAPSSSCSRTCCTTCACTRRTSRASSRPRR